MPESGWLLFLLSLLTLCALTMTITLLLVAADFRRALRRVNRSLDTAQRVLAMIERGARQVDHAVRYAAGMAGGLIDRVTVWKEKATALMSGRFGNGVGSEPHRRYRRS